MLPVRAVASGGGSVTRHFQPVEPSRGARQVAKDAGVDLRFMSWKLGQPWPARNPPPTDERHLPESDANPTQDDC
jgi:hypothetical protein